MPATPNSSTVLVTGSSGFIAAWIVRAFLEKGFTVIGTVRSAAKGAYLVDLFKAYGDRFSYTIVEDMIKPGAFDDVVKNVDLVVHTASVFTFSLTEVEDFYGPAIKGTTGVLESVLKHGSQVKRVIITSSAVALFSPKDNYTFTESDWNEYSPKLVEEQGKDAGPMHIYFASKALAERAAWKFVEDHSERTWDLVTILPPWVFGPVIHEISSLGALNQSNAIWKQSLFDSDETQEEVSRSQGSWVDVRDVAEAHVLASLREPASGQRFIVSSGEHVSQNWLDALNKAGVEGAKKGYPGTPKGPPNWVTSGAKAARELGIVYTTLDKTAVDTAASLAALKQRLA